MTILSLLLIAVALFAYKIWRAKSKSKSLNYSTMFFVGLVFVIASSWLTSATVDELKEFSVKRQWLAVTGVVVSSKVVGEKRAFKPEIVYTYKIDSTIYTDTSINLSPEFGGKAKKRDVARKIVATYIPKESLSVYVNPSNREESSLQIALSWDVYARLGFGLCLYIVGLILLMNIKDTPQVRPHP